MLAAQLAQLLFALHNEARVAVAAALRELGDNSARPMIESAAQSAND
jgi:hypothetical protein